MSTRSLGILVFSCVFALIAATAVERANAEGSPAPSLSPRTVIHEDRPTTIEIGADVTTIVFPFSIDNAHGNGFTMDPAKFPADYILARNGTKMLTVSRREGSKPTEHVLNVIAGEKIYPLTFKPIEGKASNVVRLALPGGM